MQLREILSYNKETGAITWAKNLSHGRKKGDAAGWIQGSKQGKRRYVKVDQKQYISTRLAYYLVNGKWPKSRIYHKDGDRLNDAWCNLEESV